VLAGSCLISAEIAGDRTEPHALLALASQALLLRRAQRRWAAPLGGGALAFGAASMSPYDPLTPAELGATLHRCACCAEGFWSVGGGMQAPARRGGSGAAARGARAGLAAAPVAAVRVGGGMCQACDALVSSRGLCATVSAHEKAQSRL
jgi:hypothetical protein